MRNLGAVVGVMFALVAFGGDKVYVSHVWYQDKASCNKQRVDKVKWFPSNQWECISVKDFPPVI